jgi:hypothetical protein
LKKKKRVSSDGASTSSAGIVIADCEDDDAQLLCLGAVNVVFDNKWMLDSGSSYHVCPKRSYFHTYQPCTGSVEVGNGVRCEIIGIGTIKFWMFDGVVRILTNVKHIPDISKNLISLGALETEGSHFLARDGKLLVFKDDKPVIKGLRQKNLYILQGNVLASTVDIVDYMVEPRVERSDAEASTSRSGEEPSTSGRTAIIDLWHSRLGHLSGKGLTTLANRDLLQGVKSGKLSFCEDCILGKQRKVSFSSSSYQSHEILE